MKKFLLILALMLPCLGAWAQVPAGFFAGSEVTFTNIQQDGTTKYTLYINENNELASSTSSAEELGGAAKFFVEKRANNKYSFYNREKELYMIWRGKGAGHNSDKGVLDEYNATYCDWTINAGAEIASTQTYFFVGKRSNGTSDGTLVVLKSSGVFDAWGNTQALSGTYSNLYDINVVNREYVADASAFENGKIYTFVTERGWMGAKEDNNNVISTAKTTVDPAPSAANTYFQWTVYQSENGNYYLYNIGKGMFMGVQASNNASVPFVVSPAGEMLTFKVSSNPEYPIMFSTNNAAVVNHSANHGDGCISWTGGWGTLDDTGSNHKVEVVGTLDSETLATIKEKVDAFEADNTLAVAELDAAIATVQALFEYVGTGVGKYSPTDNDYKSKFDAIVAFRNAIQATNTPTPAEVKAKTAELEALVATFQLNMPEDGKFYRINNGGNYITSNVTNDGKIALSGDYDNAASVYYYDGTHLLAFNTGLYMGLNASDWAFEAVGSNDISAIEFVAAANGAIGQYNICSGTRWLHRTDNYVNRCSSNPTNHPEHNWTITEVTWLPIPVNVEAGWTTLYSPVELALSNNRFKAYTATSIEGNSVVLEEQTVVPANVGVVLELQEGAQVVNGCVFLEIKATETEATSLLEGTYADTYVAEDAYVLGYVGEEGSSSKEVGFYKALLNVNIDSSNDIVEGEGEEATTTPVPEAFKNNGFKAYLPASVVPTSANTLRFNFGGNTTAIESVVAPAFDVNAPIYDLSGRRVVNAVKGGLYIQNGKKFIVR